MKELWIRVLLSALVSFLLARTPLVLTANATEVISRGQARKIDSVIEFSGYTGVSVDHWLRAKGFKFEKDARNRRLLQLSVANDALILEAKGRLSGFLLNDVDLERVTTIRIEWGIIQYPQDVSYARKVNNEALMLYVFFGREHIPSGHILIPNSPYFIGLFLCDDEQMNFPLYGTVFPYRRPLRLLGQT